MAKTIENLFVLIATYSNFLPFFLFIFFFKRLKNEKSFIIIAISAILFALLDWLSDHTTGVFRAIVYSSFTFFEYITFVLIIFFYLKTVFFKKLLKIFSIVFLVFLSLYYCLFKISTIDSIPIGIETIFILVSCIFYFYEQINDVDSLFIYTKYHFWIITGMLLYLGCSFFIYVLATQVSHQTLLSYWFLTNIFYAIKNVFFSVGFFLYLKGSQKPRSALLQPYLN